MTKPSKCEFWLYQIASLLTLLVFLSFSVIVGVIFTLYETNERVKNDDKESTKSGIVAMSIFSLISLYGIYLWFRNFLMNYNKLECLIAVIECFAEGMIVPYFPRAMDIESATFGALISTNAIAKLLASLLVGLYIAEIGPKRAIVWSMVSNTIGLGILGFCPRIKGNTNNLDLGPSDKSADLALATSFLSFTLMGAGGGGYITAQYAIILDTFPETFSQEIGFYEIFSGLGSSIAPLMAGTILELIDDDFIWVGLLGTLVGILCLLGSIFCLKELENSQPSKIKEAISLLRNFGIQIAFSAILLGMGVLYALQALLESHVSGFVSEDEPIKAGLPWAFSGICYAITAPFWGKIINNPSRARYCLFIGISLMAITLFLFDDRFLLVRILGLSVPSSELKNAQFIYFNTIIALNGSLLAAPIIASYQVMNDITLGELKFPATIGNLGLISTCWNIGYSLSNVLGPTIFGGVGQIFDFYVAMRVYGLCLGGLGFVMLVYYYVKFWRFGN